MLAMRLRLACLGIGVLAFPARPSSAQPPADNAMPNTWQMAFDTAPGRVRTLILASYPTGVEGGELGDVQLVARCRDRKLDAFLVLGWRTRADSNAVVGLRVQWGDAAGDSSYWKASPDRLAVFAQAPAAFLERGLARQKRLRLHVPREVPSPGPAAVVTYEFDVGGFENEIRRVKKECPGALWTDKTPEAFVAGPERDYYFEFQVDKQVTPRPSTERLKYPNGLRLRRVEGHVLIQFVVHTDGAADMRTFKVIRSTHPWFTEAVREYVSQLRFNPAEVRGRAVRQLVQQPFNFTLTP